MEILSWNTEKKFRSCNAEYKFSSLYHILSDKWHISMLNNSESSRDVITVLEVNEHRACNSDQKSCTFT